MKQVFRSQCAIAALMLVFGAFSYTYAQAPSATPDPFVTQLTSTPAGIIGAPFLSPATDISANGRFVVFESNGNVATQSPNNADGNREIFLADYAQRKIFQLTNTKNVPKAAPSPSPTPTPSPTPSPSPSPVTPADPATVQIEVSNNRPIISFAPTPIVGGPSAGKLVYTIVFSSNAIDPTNPSVNPSSTDANQEIWILQLAPATNLTEAQIASGAEFSEDLFTGSTFRQITNTPASRPPTAGTGTLAPNVADDNRDAMISDNGNIIAFVSTRDFAGAGAGNADANPELFMASRTGGAWSTFNLVQGTNTQDEVGAHKTFARFQQNPSLSANGLTVAFLSTANLATPGLNNDDGANHGNAEVYLADFTGGAVVNIRQVTRTKTDATGSVVNTLSHGRRLSRDASMIAFTSRAADPKADAASNQNVPAVFLYVVGTDTFVQVGPRGIAFPGDILQFPTFTDYIGLNPTSVVFASALNFRTDGTLPAQGQESTGLNPTNQPQIFASTIPVTGNSLARLTNNPVGGFGGIRPLASASRKRIAFSLAGSELGGGNADSSMEVFYLLIPEQDTVSTARLDFFTGASNFPIPAASPPASPSPSPTPTPGPGVPFGLAPGELSIVRSSEPADPLAPSDAAAGGGDENARRPILPIELNGVSVSINGAAAGLYFVGDTEGIRFVVPIGVPLGVVPVVVNNNGRVFRGFLNIVAAQPDLFSSTSDAGGTAVICNVTNPAAAGCVPGPFRLTSFNGTTTVPTVIEIHLTGVRDETTSETSVAIGSTSITPTSVRSNTSNFGFDLITLTLPSTLPTGTHTVIVTVTKGSVVTRSRPAATAPTITIIP